MIGKQWVWNEQFDKISLPSEDHVFASKSGKIVLLSEAELFTKRAKREKVVLMLVSPTQAASALDVPSIEGRTVLMYGAMYGLCSVVEQLLAAGARSELTDTHGLTALLLACGKGQEGMISLLIAPDAGASALDVQDTTSTLCTADADG